MISRRVGSAHLAKSWSAALLLLIESACAPLAPTPAPAKEAPAATAQPNPAATALKSAVLGMPVTPPNLPHVGVYLAQELGYFADEGLEIEIKNFQSGTQVLRGGISGGLDAIGSSSEPVFAAIAQGAELRVIYSYAHKLTVAMVVQENIQSPADLRSKRIGIQEVGAFREVMSRVILQNAGLSQQDVLCVTLANSGYIPGLVADQIDTAILHVDQTLHARHPRLLDRSEVPKVIACTEWRPTCAPEARSGSRRRADRGEPG